MRFYAILSYGTLVGFRLCIHGSLNWNSRGGAVINHAVFYLKERPLHITSKTISFNRPEVATSLEDLAINFEFAISAEFKLKLRGFTVLVYI